MPAILLAIALMVSCWTAAADTPQSATTGVSAAQAESLIKDLEDPAARERLIRQIKLLARAEAPAQPENQVQSATTELLRAVSNRLASFGASVLQISGSLNELPHLLTWARTQAEDPQTRVLWVEILVNLALVLGLGYLAFYLVRLLLRRPYRAVAGRSSKSLLTRSLLLMVVLLLDLIPIAAFALAAYLTLGVLDPREQTRLIALAWINASIIVRLVLAVGRMIFAPAAPVLRLPPLSDETAHYADIWIRRLTFVPVYGYFALQAGLLLGLPWNAYQALLRLLGLLVTLLVVVLIVQNRAVVGDRIRGATGEEGVSRTMRFRALRNRLAQVWFLLAGAYVFVLYGIWALNIDGGFLFLVRATVLSLLILSVGQVASRLLDEAFRRGFRINRELRTRFPGLEARANRYVPAMHAILRALLYGLVIIGVLQAWGMDTFEWLLSEPGRVLGRMSATILAIVAVSVGIWEIVSTSIENYLAERDRFGRVRVRSGRARTLLTVARNALLVFIVVVSTLLILAELGMNITPLIAGAGVVGVAIGFGSQKLVQDIITGVFILFEDLVSVGDVVDVGGKSGVVEAVSIRNVRLRDLSGTVHTIPFSAISTISNLTKDFSYYVFDVGIAYQENVDEVMEVLKGIGSQLQEDPEFGPLILAPLEVLGVDAFQDSAVVIKARIKTLPIKQWSVGREFNRRMKMRFDELGIEIPFPHRTLYFGADKSGAAPPARVVLSPGIGVQGSPLAKLRGEDAAWESRLEEAYNKG